MFVFSACLLSVSKNGNILEKYQISYEYKYFLYFDLILAFFIFPYSSS